jgi:hypothetical protein
MLRGPRLDAPGTLHHVMVRGIKRRSIFRDGRDRDDFVCRLGGMAETGALTSMPGLPFPTMCTCSSTRGRRPWPGVCHLFTALCGAPSAAATSGMASRGREGPLLAEPFATGLVEGIVCNVLFP